VPNDEPIRIVIETALRDAVARRGVFVLEDIDRTTPPEVGFPTSLESFEKV
jgi:hypothetical protein